MSLKNLNAIAVVASKNVAFSASIAGFSIEQYSPTFVSSIAVPSTRILSVKESRCGDV